MGMIPMSQAPNMDEMLRAMNGFGHETHISEDCWVGDPNMSGLGLEDSHYGVPGIGLEGDAGQQVAQIISQGIQVYGQIDAQKQAAKRAASEARQARLYALNNRSSGGGGMTQTLLILGALIVVGYLIMQMMKKKGADGAGAAPKPEDKKD